jgi:hypothetical protein
VVIISDGQPRVFARRTSPQAILWNAAIAVALIVRGKQPTQGMGASRLQYSRNSTAVPRSFISRDRATAS